MTYANEHLWLEKHGKLLLDVLYSQIFYIAIGCWLLAIQDDMKMLVIHFL